MCTHSRADFYIGRVLDFGSGSGEYLKYAYDSGCSTPVTELVALEPNLNLHAGLTKRIAVLEQEQQARCAAGADKAVLRTAIKTCFAEQLEDEVGAGYYDWIILGNVFCEVPEPAPVLQALDRLLKPGGMVFFSEHVRFGDGSFYVRGVCGVRGVRDVTAIHSSPAVCVDYRAWHVWRVGCPVFILPLRRVSITVRDMCGV